MLQRVAVRYSVTQMCVIISGPFVVAALLCKHRCADAHLFVCVCVCVCMCMCVCVCVCVCERERERERERECVCV